jgi:hypothetical protein
MYIIGSNIKTARRGGNLLDHGQPNEEVDRVRPDVVGAPGGSYADYEAAQKRILGIFDKWEIPESLTFHQFLVRVGEFGGYAVVETDDLAEIEKAIATYAVFQFRLEPVLEVADAVAAQAEGIAWREEHAPS